MHFVKGSSLLCYAIHLLFTLLAQSYPECKFGDTLRLIIGEKEFMHKVRNDWFLTALQLLLASIRKVRNYLHIQYFYII